MAALLNDGTLPYGARILQLSSSAGVGYEAFVCEDISRTKATKQIKRYNELGEPSGQVIVADFESGTATAQLASGSQYITTGDTFSVAFDGTNTKTYVITNVDQGENQDSARNLNISYNEVIN